MSAAIWQIEREWVRETEEEREGERGEASKDDILISVWAMRHLALEIGSKMASL